MQDFSSDAPPPRWQRLAVDRDIDSLHEANRVRFKPSVTAGVNRFFDRTSNNIHTNNQFSNSESTVASLTNANTATNIVSSLRNISPPSYEASTTKNSPLSAGMGMIGGALLGGLFDVVNTGINAGVKSQVANRQLDLQNDQLSFSKDQYNADWTATKNLGLYHPSQLGGLFGGADQTRSYQLGSRSLISVPKSSRQNSFTLY